MKKDLLGILFAHIGLLDGKEIETIFNSFGINDFQINGTQISIPSSSVEDIVTLNKMLMSVHTPAERAFTATINDDKIIIPTNNYKTGYPSKTKNSFFSQKSDLNIAPPPSTIQTKDDEIDPLTLNRLFESLTQSQRTLYYDTAALSIEINDLFQQLDQLVRTKKIESEKQGKKLLVIIGEDHLAHKSLLVEQTLLKVISKYGIKNIVTETTDDLLKEIRIMPVTNSKPNLCHLLTDIDSGKFRVVSSEKDFTLPTPIREQNMKSVISSLNENAVFITGANHLVTIGIDEKINDQFTILKINASNETKADLHIIKAISPYQDLLTSIATNSPEIFQAKINTDVNHAPKMILAKQVREMLTEIISKTSAKEDLKKSVTEKPALLDEAVTSPTLRR